MSRLSPNVYDAKTGYLVHGFDYENQAWVLNGVYERCGHPDLMDCDCFGRLHAGEPCRLPVKTEEEASS